MGTDKPVRILTIAGSDSGGGAGVQGDIKTISALGGYAMSAITSVTAQDTQGIGAVVDLDAAFVREQICRPAEDIGVDGIKIGMVRKVDVVEAIAMALEDFADVPLVIDPIVAASDGTTFQSGDVLAKMKAGLLPLADVLTPNVPEAEALLDRKIGSADDMKQAADQLLSLGCASVLLTGGHLPGDEVVDVLASQETIEVMVAPRIETDHTHGTGCALSSALVTLLAQGFDLREAVYQAREFVHEAIAHAPGFGFGHGPLHHQFLHLIDDIQ